ncbi:MAG: carboxyl transferase domain-containing protein [Actinomycetota bacterium]
MIPLEIQAQRPGATEVSVSEIDGRRCVRVRVGDGDQAALLGVDDGTLLAIGAHVARENGVPIVCHINSGGVPPSEGVEALHGWGVAARELTRSSGIIPIVMCVHETAVSGSALLLGLADIVVMIEGSYSYVSGPRMVQEYTGVPIDNDDLGGARRHAGTSGVAAAVVATTDEADAYIADVLGILPANSGALPPIVDTADPPDRLLPDVADIVPTTAMGSYDVRDIVAEVVDDGFVLELRAEWAANLVTALASVGGRPIGVVANQPQHLAGTLDIPASQKGAGFVAFCDAFNLPLLTLVDTSGFLPGKDLEWRGMIRHGAQLAFAYARASVPRVNVTLRKSYGGAYIVMDSKYMGNDLALAWPTAEIAVMGAKGAVEILHRKADEVERAERELEYEDRLLNPYIAAERGSVDMVIDPASTRRQVAAAFEALASKRENLRRRIHDNTPL